MSGYKTSTDWTRNQNQDAIIYQDALGNTIEVTLEQYLAADRKNHTVAKFLEIKKLSDGFFEEEDKGDRDRARKECPLYEWAGEYVTESLEEELVECSDHEAHQAYLRRRKKMKALLPKALAALTELQRTRLLMHKVEGLTTREIADREGVKQPTVVESIQSAEKKIKKFLQKNGSNF